MATALQPRDMLVAFANTADAVFAVDQQMHIVFWNAAAERLYGLPAGDALGRHCDEIMHGYEASGAVLCVPDCRVLGCSRRGRAADNYDVRREDGAGRLQWLNVSIVLLEGAHRNDTLTVHLIRDVTAQKAVEQRSAQILGHLGSTGRDDAPAGNYGITKRESEVLRLLACGATNAAIADTLGISQTTVRNHIEHLLAKLGVHSKLEAVVQAARSGLV